MLTFRRFLACALLATVSLVPPLLAHPGGRDTYGGHNDRKNGGYHFHAGPLAGQSFADKGAATAALRAHEQARAAPKAAPAPVHAATAPAAAPAAVRECDCSALAQLLVTKGIITEAELAVALAGPR